MRKLSKLLCAVLGIVMSIGFVGCSGGGDGKPKEDTLYVGAVNKGYGIQWLYDLLDEYCEQKGLKYEVTPVYDDAQLKSKVETPEFCSYDLIFTGAISPCDVKYLADLSDVYDYQYLEGSRKGLTVKESMNSQALKVFGELRGQFAYKLMPWVGGFSSLILNKDAIDKTLGAGWETTYRLRTTDELLAFCEVLSAKGLAPFVHCADSNFYHALYDTWFAQYNGESGVDDYYNGKYIDAYGRSQVGSAVCYNDGVLESMKVMESIFSNGYSHKESNGITAEVMQTYFMLGYSAMIANGDWNNREMEKQFKDTNTVMVKTPIISALGTKLGIVESDLLALIDYVDAVLDGQTPEKPNVNSTAGLSVDELIASVTEARAWEFSSMHYQTVGVMDYNKKEIAKDFLKFMLSDRGQEIFIQASGGLTQCYGYDLEEYSGYSELSEFAKTRWDIFKDVKFHYSYNNITTFGKLGFQPFYDRSLAPIEVLLSREANRYTAQKIYEDDFSHYDSVWATYLMQIK